MTDYNRDKLPSMHMCALKHLKYSLKEGTTERFWVQEEIDHRRNVERYGEHAASQMREALRKAIYAHDVTLLGVKVDESNELYFKMFP